MYTVTREQFCFTITCVSSLHMLMMNVIFITHLSEDYLQRWDLH